MYTKNIQNLSIDIRHNHIIQHNNQEQKFPSQGSILLWGDGWDVLMNCLHILRSLTSISSDAIKN